jgi:two-component system cell cycle sensor histidine kinase/response regulator CckA
LRDILVAGVSISGETPFFPSGFVGCRPPVLRQHSYRRLVTGLKYSVEKIIASRGKKTKLRPTLMNHARDPEIEQPETTAGENSPPPVTSTVREQVLLQQKFAALNSLAAGIAHEFNNVIAGILGSAELAAMDIHEGHPAYESLRQIFEASAHGREFLYKVRAFALRPPIQKNRIQLQPVLEETVQILSGLIPDKVILHARVDPDCPAVHGDAAQLHQVVLDLCLHCWQHLHDRRGEITLALELTHVPKMVSQVISGENCVRLTVRDNGHGLEKSALEKVFDPFHSRRSSTKKSGIELFTAREVIHAHHGEILAESEPGHGLAFHIYLPIAG